MQPARILLVEDDAVMRNMLRRALGNAQYDVTPATTLEEARACVASGPFDVLVLDGLLPDGRSTELIGELRDRGDRTPVIFMSAFWRDNASKRRLQHELGVLKVLSKPFPLAALLRPLSTITAREPSAPEPAPAKPAPRPAALHVDRRAALGRPARDRGAAPDDREPAVPQAFVGSRPLGGPDNS